MQTADLSRELAAYETELADLQARHGDQWVVFYNGSFRGAFPTYDGALKFGLNNFGDVDFLVRRLNERPVSIPMLIVQG
jgi:hypothetical protein